MGRILELMSKSDEHQMERFFKCPRKYKKFPLCEFYMFEEEYANFLVNYGMLQESQMCHYRPLEMTETVEGIVQSEMYELKKEPIGRTAAAAKKGGTKKKQGHMNWMICLGVAVLVLLGFNSVILLVLVLMQMFK
ncbi:unnamed protein product [Miscanthus lutarioriparius]|uniref:Uncharacterized protein n=1 Tax=Miscanthus lutarioriparius TaxID=422564 RepID=A0A811NJT1_9POAL|nr:unnamed protein product [Miscanthus lutarioriparius]